MLKRFASPFKEFGLGGGLLYGIDRVLSRLSPRLRLYAYDLMVQPITGKPLLSEKLAARLVIREIKSGDPEIARMPVRPEVMEARLAQGCTCLGAFRNDSLIAYMWFRRGQYQEDEVRCDYVLSPSSASVFDFDFFIFPEHRMGIAFVGLWNGANAFLAQQGISYTFSRLTRFNAASRRAHQHLGWKQVGRAVFVQLFALELMVASISPFVRLTLHPAQRTRLELKPDVLQA